MRSEFAHRLESISRHAPRRRHYFAALACALLGMTSEKAASLPDAARRAQTAGTAAGPTMRKAILLDVTVDVQLWVEGNDPAPHDYAQSTARAVRQMIMDGAKKQQGLHVAIRELREREEP